METLVMTTRTSLWYLVNASFSGFSGATLSPTSSFFAFSNSGLSSNPLRSWMPIMPRPKPAT